MRVLKRMSPVNESGVKKADLDKVLGQLDGMVLYGPDDEEVEVSFKRERLGLGHWPSFIGVFVLSCKNNSGYYLFAPKADNKYALFVLKQNPKADCRVSRDWVSWQEDNRRNLLVVGDLNRVINKVRQDVAESLDIEF